MKKIVLGSICIVTLLLATACGGSTSEASTEESAESLENAVDGSDSQTEIETEDISDNSDLENELDGEDDIAPESEVLLDTDGYYVEFQGIEEYSDESWIVDLYVENNTDSDVYLVLSNGLVNGCMIDFSNATEKMAAGSKYMSTANFDYIIHVSDLQDYNIESIETLEFEASIREEILGEDIESASARIDMKKSVPMKAGETEDIIGESIYDSDGVYIEYRGVEEYSSESLIIDLYIENNRDSDVWVSLSDGLVNGYTVSFSNSNDNILAGSKYLSVPNFKYIIHVEDLETYGIETIDSLSFKITISTSLLGDTIGEVVFNSDQEVAAEEKSDSDDTVIDEIMERFVDAWSTTPPTISASELEGIVTYSVTTADNSRFYIAYTQNEDGTNIIEIAPADLDETTGASDWMVVVGNMVYAVDEDITQSYEGMAVFSKVLDEGSMTQNGIYYYITDENSYFTIEF